MVSITALTLKNNAPIPLKAQLKHTNLESVMLCKEVQVGAGGNAQWVVQKSQPIWLVSTEDAECLIHTIFQFKEASEPTILNITTGLEMFTYWWQCCANVHQDWWDTVAAAQVQTVPGFIVAMDNFVCNYIHETGLADMN